MFLTNESDKPARIGFAVTASNTTYYLNQLRLKPHETRVIDLRKLRNAQLTDSNKRKIPAGATDGSVSWVRIDNVPVTGRVVVISRSRRIASSYDCCICPCPDTVSSVSVSPSSASIVVTTQQGFAGTVFVMNCNGVPHEVTSGLTWQSDDTTIATMSGATATGQGGGTTNITATSSGCGYYEVDPVSGECICDYDVDVSDSASLTVLVPTSLSIVAGTDSTTSEATCPVGSSTGCGVTRSFTYQVLDQNGGPMTGTWIASQQFWDTLQTTSPNGLGVTGYRTTCSPANTGPCGFYVNSQGQFRESVLGICSTYCYSSGTCVTAGYTAANQTWHIGSYAIINQVSYYCDHVLWNGH